MRFLTDFPGGNGKLVSARERDWGWEIVFLAESKAYEPMPLWFYFRLEDLTGTKVRLRLANAEQCLGNNEAWTENRPVARTGGGWFRISSVERIPTRLRVPETWFEVPLEGSRLEFAFCFPYQLSELDAPAFPAFERAVIGCTSLGRPILRLSSDPGREGKPGFYFLARQHAGEVTGSWVMDGMLRWLSGPEGARARDAFTWWFVPMADLDGVEEGYYGKDQVWHDLNRAWAPFFAGRTELVAIQNDLRTFARCADAKLMLDLHSPGHNEREGYFVIPAEITDSRREELRRLCAAANRFLAAEGMQAIRFLEKEAGSNTSSQSGMSSSDFVWSLGMNGCSVETSYQGEHDPGRFYVPEDYRRLGSALVRALCACFGPESV